jgi:phosphoribosylanthranilate isomerase
MTAFKICGITREADAGLAVSLGASALGFVLWPGSPRHVPLARVRLIAAAIPPFVTPDGV